MTKKAKLTLPEVENPWHTMKDEPGQMFRPTPFSLLSQEAKDAIVGAMCDDIASVSDEVRDEIRKWAEPTTEERESKPYRDGAMSCDCCNDLRSSNPHPDGSNDHALWDKGWVDTRTA